MNASSRRAYDISKRMGYQGVRPKVMLMYLLNERNQLG